MTADARLIRLGYEIGVWMGRPRGEIVSAPRDEPPAGAEDLVDHLRRVSKKDDDHRFDHRPLSTFMLNETYAVVTSFVVFCASHVVAYLSEGLDGRFPVHHDGPLVFLLLSFSWVGALGAVIAFAIVTLSGLLVLARKLARR